MYTILYFLKTKSKYLNNFKITFAVSNDIPINVKKQTLIRYNILQRDKLMYLRLMLNKEWVSGNQYRWDVPAMELTAPKGLMSA